MDKDFLEGFKAVLENTSSNLGGEISELWISEINKEIENMSKAMLEEAGRRPNDLEHLHGWIAELWHKGTFNMSAKAHLSNNRAIIPNANGYASSDVSIIDKNGNVLNTNQLKYIKGNSRTMKELSISPWEDYCHRKALALKEGKTFMSYDEFLKERGIDKDLGEMAKYYGSGKIVPQEKIQELRKIAILKIEAHKNRTNPSKEAIMQAKKWQEVLDTLDSVVKDGKGNASKDLSYEQAVALAKAASEGKVDADILKEYGIDINQLVSFKDIMRESFCAGITAATISLIISITPFIVNMIMKVVSKEKITKNDFAKFGLNALSESGKSFINGSISAAIVACCKTGKFGDSLVNASVPAISSLVVIVLGTISSALKLADGKIDKNEMARDIMQLYTTTTFSFAGGTILAIICDGFPPAYLIGSLVGGIIGGFAYKLEEHLILSLCRNSDCTFFGLVDQDYKIPIEVLEDMHLDLYKFDKINIYRFEYDKFQFDKFKYDRFAYDSIGIKVLKRDLIGVFKIGYKQ